MDFGSAAFWAAFVQIIWIDILLSGDNAVVIALACRSLPERQRKWGMILGAGVAVLMRIGFAGIMTTLMTLPWLKIAGAVLLMWVAIKLVGPPEDSHGNEAKPADNLWKAVRTIAIADAVMSLDNVIAIAGAAKGNVGLIAFGLILSIPLIVAGSAIIMRVMERLPVLVWAGGALLGWIAGELLVSDPLLAAIVPASGPLHWLAPVTGAMLVLMAGWLLRRRAGDAQLNEV
jgi:YjbE family integral membrane protein